LVFRLITAIATPIAASAVLETTFRVFDIPGPELVPRESYENAAAVDNIRNALGLRERWEQVPGDENTVRIAFLGDSITYAAGVEQEDGFVHKVEELLNHDGPLRFVTINIGQQGTDPVAQLPLFQRVIDTVRPHVVVHVLYPNDLGRDLYEDLKLIHALQYRRSLPAQYSHVWRFFERRLRYRNVFQRTVDYFHGGDSPFKRQRAWSRLTEGVTQAKAIAEQHDARYVMVMWPWLARLDDYPLEEVHEGVRALARRLNVPYLDLLDTFRHRDARRMRISIIDEHPTPVAHDLAAVDIIRFLNSSGILRR